MSDRYVFIDAEYADDQARAAGGAPTITCMCGWLGVSKSGFYEWRSRPDSVSARRRARLKLIIGKIFADSDGTYGYRRVAAELARQGVRPRRCRRVRAATQPGPGLTAMGKMSEWRVQRPGGNG